MTTDSERLKEYRDELTHWLSLLAAPEKAFKALQWLIDKADKYLHEGTGLSMVARNRELEAEVDKLRGQLKSLYERKALEGE